MIRVLITDHEFDEIQMVDSSLCCCSAPLNFDNTLKIRSKVSGDKHFILYCSCIGFQFESHFNMHYYYMLGAFICRSPSFSRFICQKVFALKWGLIDFKISLIH